MSTAFWSAIGGFCLGITTGYFSYRSLRLNEAIARTRVGCGIVPVETPAKGVATTLLSISIDFYNEGQLPAERMKGQWKISSDHLAEPIIRPLFRDVLGKCEKYRDTHIFEQSSGLRWIKATFEIEVELEYTATEAKMTKKSQKLLKRFHFDRQAKIVRS